MKFLVDTNILLRWTDRTSPEHTACTKVIEHLRKSMAVYVCAQVLIEYYSVATRPRDVNGLGLDGLTAQQALADIIEALPCLPEPPDMALRWQEIVVRHNVLGKQVHDARLIAVMAAHDVRRLITLNTGDFMRYRHIIPLRPSDVLTG